MEASLQSEVRGGVGVAQQTGVSRRGNVGGRRHRTGTVLLRGSDSLLQGGGPGGGGSGLAMLLVEVDHLWGEPNGSGGLVRLWRVTMFHLLRPGKPNLPLGLRGKAGGCARVTAGPKS